MMQFLRFYYNTRPKNVDAYREKLHHQNIELRDERKVQIRSRSGYITWAITMVCCFIASFVAALFRVGNMIVVLLWVIGMAEYLVALIVYKYLDKKM